MSSFFLFSNGILCNVSKYELVACQLSAQHYHSASLDWFKCRINAEKGTDYPAEALKLFFKGRVPRDDDTLEGTNSFRG